MNHTTIQEWISTLSMAFSLVATACGILFALHKYKLKLQEETRLAQTAQIEADVKLLNLFTQIMDVAHGRGSSVLASDKVFDTVLPFIQAQGNMEVKEAAVIVFPVGAACQDAAIAAIGELGKRHKLLRPIALRGLKSLATIKPEIVNPALMELLTHPID